MLPGESSGLDEPGRVVTDRKSKAPVDLTKQEAWGSMIKTLAAQDCPSIGWGDDQVKLGE